MKEESALFKYELAIVAILKNEAPYVKEWLDYHLLAGVDHFYIYDNESPDNLKEVLQPYVDADVVTYALMPGKCAQMLAYNDAVDKYKFDCRYMAFIDGDEFIFPRGFSTIKDVLRQTIDNLPPPHAAGLTINWHVFGSNGLEKAELEKGVLDRFFYRTPDDFDVNGISSNGHVKTIANPRCIDNILNPHFAFYYLTKFAVDENGKVIPSYSNPDVPDKKIIINHYKTKSKEEFNSKIERGNADTTHIRAKIEDFINIEQAATIFDDSILQYRQQRYEQLSDPEGNLTLQFDSLETINRRRFNALVQSILPLTFRFSSTELFKGKLHHFLTCRAVSHSFVEDNNFDRPTAEFFEELSLRCAYQSLAAGELEVWQLLLLLDELPKILSLKYDAIDNIKYACLQLIPQLMSQYRLYNDWRQYKHFNYLLKMLEE